MTVAPLLPTAATRVGEANAAAKIGCDEGVIAVAAWPPSVVRSSTSPLTVVIRQVFGSRQRIELRSWPAPAAGAFQVFPAAPVARSVLLRIADPDCASSM